MTFPSSASHPSFTPARATSPYGPGPGVGARPPLAPSPALSPRDLAAMAAACLVVDDARLDGLIDGDPGIDREQCTRILARLKDAEVVPPQDEIDAAALRLMGAPGAVRP